jgi:hypothetical protein
MWVFKMLKYVIGDSATCICGKALKFQQAHFNSDEVTTQDTACGQIMYDPYFSCPKCTGANCRET